MNERDLQTSDHEGRPRKPLQHKTVREVAGEEILSAIRPVEARMKGMEDWLTENSKVVREELLEQARVINEVRSQIRDARTQAGLPLRFTAPWWVRAWWWVKRLLLWPVTTRF